VKPDLASAVALDTNAINENFHMEQTQRLVAILPCNDLDRSEAFYRRLGFEHRDGDDEYRMLSDGRGGELHLNRAVEGWLIPGRNPFGFYLYTETVDELAAKMGCQAENKPWGMYEFALSDPDETLVRVGWPTRLRT
jgi:catechol 2,3-dioxygenase-like lactoylglutathione lyase family enzyme